MSGPPEPPAAGGTEAGPALGRDPFEQPLGADPFVEGLEALGLALPVPAASPASDAYAFGPDAGPGAGPDAGHHARHADNGPGPPAPAPAPRGPHYLRTPRLGEIEPGRPADWLDRWLDDDHRRRLLSLSHLTEPDAGYDPYGLSPEALRRTFPWFHAIYRHYFRVRSRGHEHLPAEGPAILAANHGGLLPFDGAMLVLDVMLHTDPPRLPRAIVDRWAGTLPWVNVLYARVGQVVGTRQNFAELLREGQLPLVFPEGTAGIRKTVAQRYRLQRFHVGFVEEALRAGAPIVPTAVIGSDDQAPILYDARGLARALGLPAAPVTPTFPWLGPLGLLPYPVRYRIVYGEPLDFSDRFGPEDADDPELVERLARRVRASIQRLLDRR